MIKRTIWILNLVSTLALMLSLLASHISPEKIWWLALFGSASRFFTS
jgi:hypothetical protein